MLGLAFFASEQVGRTGKYSKIKPYTLCNWKLFTNFALIINKMNAYEQIV